MFDNEKTISYAKHRYSEDCIFCSFHTLIKCSIIFSGTSTTMHKVSLIQKRIRIMLGIGPMTSCRTGLRNLTY